MIGKTKSILQASRPNGGLIPTFEQSFREENLHHGVINLEALVPYRGALILLFFPELRDVLKKKKGVFEHDFRSTCST